jgi:hypothetical protein
MLPFDCLVVIVDRLIKDISPMYWPYDVMEDVRIMADVNQCHNLVKYTRDTLSSMRYDYSARGKCLDEGSFQGYYGISPSVVPKKWWRPSSSGTTKVIDGSVLRRYFRSRYSSTVEYYTIFLKNPSGTAKELLQMLVDDKLKMKPERKLLDAYESKLQYVSDKFQCIEKIDTRWLYYNYIQKPIVDTELVDYHVENSVCCKHVLLKNLFRHTCLDVGRFQRQKVYDDEMFHRANHMSCLVHPLNSEDIVWDYVINDVGVDKILQRSKEVYMAKLIDYNLPMDVAMYFAQTCDQEHIECGMQVVNCLEYYNVTPIWDDYNTAPEDMLCSFYDLEKDGYCLGDIPDNWVRDDYGHYHFWSFDLVSTHNDDLEMACVYMSNYSTLAKALAEVGLTIRQDSSICREFVMNGDGELDDIVAMMQEMKFFCEKTRYGYFMTGMYATTKNTRHEDSEISKKAALHEYDGETDCIPLRFQNLTDEMKKEAYDIAMNAVAEYHKRCDYSDNSDYSDEEYY